MITVIMFVLTTVVALFVGWLAGLACGSIQAKDGNKPFLDALQLGLKAKEKEWKLARR